MAKAQSAAEGKAAIYRCPCGADAAYEATHRDVEQTTTRVGGIDRVVEGYRRSYLCVDCARAASISDDHPRSLDALPHYAAAVAAAHAEARRKARRSYVGSQPRFGEEWGKR